MVHTSLLPKGFSLLELALVVLILSTLSMEFFWSSGGFQAYAAHLKRELLISDLEDSLLKLKVKVVVEGTKQDDHGNQYLLVSQRKISMIAGHLRMLNARDPADYVNFLALLPKSIDHYTVPSAMLDHQRIHSASFTSSGQVLMLAVADACFVRIRFDKSNTKYIAIERYPRETC